MLLTVLPVLVIVLISMIIGRVATTALTLTGMSREQARFQARSALTGAGFTTTESESIVTHPVRRRIVMTLMLTGSAGIVSVIGTIAIGAARANARETDPTFALLGLVAGIVVLLWVMRLRPVDRVLSRLIRAGLRRYTDLDVRDVESLLDIHGGYSIAELLVEETDWLCDRTLVDMRLNDEGILILGIQRRNGGYDGAPTGTSAVHAGDTLLLYGHQNRIAQLDDRVQGPLGDAEHRRSSAAMAASTDRDGHDEPPAPPGTDDDHRDDDPSRRAP